MAVLTYGLYKRVLFETIKLTIFFKPRNDYFLVQNIVIFKEVRRAQSMAKILCQVLVDFWRKNIHVQMNGFPEKSKKETLAIKDRKTINMMDIKLYYLPRILVTHSEEPETCTSHLLET